MLHTKIRGNQSTGPGEEGFLKVYIIYRHGSNVGHVTITMLINFISMYTKAYTQNLV